MSDIDSSEFTSEAIAERMAKNLKNPTSRLEGSFAMDSIHAVSEEMSRLMNMRIIELVGQSMLDTAENEYLDRKGADFGLSRNFATPAVGYAKFKGASGIIIPKGLTILSEDNSFTTDYEGVIPSAGEVSIRCTCVNTGTEGNILENLITGIRQSESISGVSVTNEEAFEGGTDDETDEAYRERIYQKIRLPLSSGNANSYVYWAKQVSGVGNARCEPLWDGAGTVKVTILGTDGQLPDDEIIKNVEAYIEKERPIGAKVTVAKAQPQPIVVSSSVKLSAGYKKEDVKNQIFQTIKEYLTGIAYESENKVLSFYKISDLIFNCSGVDDILDYEINGEKKSVVAGSSEFFMLEEVKINED